jgi:hypothetical protein
MSEKITKFEAENYNSFITIKGYYLFAGDEYSDQFVMAKEDIPGLINTIKNIDHDPEKDYDGVGDTDITLFRKKTEKRFISCWFSYQGWSYQPNTITIGTTWYDGSHQNGSIHIPYKDFNDMQSQLSDLVKVIESCI